MALSTSIIKKLFGDFTWQEHPESRGRIIPDGDWVRANIGKISVPYYADEDPKVRRVYCHRQVAQALEDTFDELDTKGLLYLVRTIDGCFVPRHICWNPKKGLSRHSWGIAIDLNASSYPFGLEKEQDIRLVNIMASHGFAYGGGNSPEATDEHKSHRLFKRTQDSMHFAWNRPYIG